MQTSQWILPLVSLTYILIGGTAKLHAAEGAEVLPLKERGLSTLELVMLEVPAGTFVMGSKEEVWANDETQHEVRITEPFWFGKTEVTQAQWEKVMGNNPSQFTGDLRRPVEQVSWSEAMAFCDRLTEMERAAGKLPEGFAFTLPTEAQWEYACGAGTAGLFAGNVGEMAWYDRNSDRTTHPVATKKANGWGFHDMHGNVFEWCFDWYAKYPPGARTDPQGPEKGTARIRRGGCWGNDASKCRTAVRSRNEPKSRFSALGFRLCLAPVRQLPGQ